MPDRIQNMREQRAKLVKQARELNDKALEEKRDLSAEEQQSWDDINADVDKLGESITAAEARQQRLQAFDEDPQVDELRMAIGGGEAGRLPADDPEQRASQGVAAWMRMVSGATLSDEDRAILQRSNLANSQHVDIPLGQASRARQVGSELRAQDTSSAGAGGELVPTTLVGHIEKALQEFGSVRSVARLLRTASGESMPVPEIDDTGESGEDHTENGAAGTDGDLAFENPRRDLGAHTIDSKLIKVSFELMEDSAFDLAAFIGELLGERLGRRQNLYCTTGNGTTQPQGCATAATQGKEAAAAAAIAADELIDLFHSVGRPYRRRGVWQMADTTVAAIRKLKGSDNNYLWQPGLVAGEPDMILGKRLVYNDDVAAIGANNKSVIFGDMMRFWLREVRGIRLMRLNERFADAGSVGFIAFMRFDSLLVDAGAGALKALVHPSS